jgi:hypothetical protein
MCAADRISTEDNKLWWEETWQAVRHAEPIVGDHILMIALRRQNTSK